MTFREYSFQDHIDVFKIIDSIIKSYGYDYYLIGANARDVQLYKAGMTPTRATGDIDFAVMIPSIEDYEEFIQKVIENGFEKTNQKYRVIYLESNTIVDILPYGEIAQDYTLNFNERNTELSVLGFLEVGIDKEQFEIDDNFSIPISPAHGLIILKLISWNENNERNKDLKDIRSILDAAWELYQDDLYKEDSPHFDLLDEEDFEIQNIASRIMGRKMGPLLEKCRPLKDTIISILEEEIQSPSNITTEMSVDNDSIKVITLLKNLLVGIHETLE
jgi:predicted nucleotidyltransferase